MDDNSIGATTALISGIRTKVDGSVSITLDMLPQDQDLVSKLLQMYTFGDRQVFIAFVHPDGIKE